MKNLKIFENFNDEKEIIEFCKKHYIRNYTINKDGSIDADYVNFGVYTKQYPRGYKFNKIPIKFNRVNGEFACHHNNLITLKNSPIYINGDFYCDNNIIKTLIDGPNQVNGNYYCNNNNLRDVYGFPENFNNKLHIEENPVQEIVFLPIGIVKRTFKFTNEKLIQFINLLNDYTVIRNRNTIIRDRLEEAINGIGIKWEVPQIPFKHYKLI